MAGFEFAYRLDGESPNIVTMPVADAGDHSGGILANLESGEVDPAATNDTNLAGVILGPKDPDDDLAALADADEVEIIVNDDAVYRVADANARSAGDTLDINGAAVTSPTNDDLIVVANCTASEPTLVRINPASHYAA